MNLFRRTILVLVALAFVAPPVWGDGKPRVPTIDDLLNIDAAGGARISPDGKWVAYTVTHSDFKKDVFLDHLWIAEPASGRTYQLTRGDKSAGDSAWSPDSTWLAFTSSRAGDKNQIFAIAPDGGEAVQLTKAETGVTSYQWSRDSKSIAFTAAPTKKDVTKNRKEHLGDFEVVRKAEAMLSKALAHIEIALDQEIRRQDDRPQARSSKGQERRQSRSYRQLRVVQRTMRSHLNSARALLEQ